MVEAEALGRPLPRRTLLGWTAAGLLGLPEALAAAGTAAGPGAFEPAEDLIGELGYHVTDGERTLLQVAREAGLGVLEVSAANPGVDVWVPGEGRPILMPTAHLLPDGERAGLVINKAELRLYVFGDDGRVETHPIGVGRDGFDTPTGETRIVRKQAAPSWYPTAATRADNPELPAVVGPGPENPLGDFALYLGWPTYLIHGTNKPFGVGRRVSRGCIRMYPESIAHLYETLHVDTPVRVIEQPVKLGRSRGEVYLEIHPDLVQLDELEARYGFMPRPPEGVEERVREVAGPDLSRVDWKAVEAEGFARRGIPIQITRPFGAASGGEAGTSDVRQGFGGLY